MSAVPAGCKILTIIRNESTFVSRSLTCFVFTNVLSHLFEWRVLNELVELSGTSGAVRIHTLRKQFHSSARNIIRNMYTDKQIKESVFYFITKFAL